MVAVSVRVMVASWCQCL